MINRTSNTEKLRKDKHNGKTIFKLKTFYSDGLRMSMFIMLNIQASNQACCCKDNVITAIGLDDFLILD